MKILELFSGSGIFSRIAMGMGCETFTVDANPIYLPDLVMDIEYLRIDQIPFTPDVIWASPPCTSYSIAAISTHRRGQEPISALAIKSDRLVKKTLEIINHYGCIYYIENPVGMLRKMEFMKDLPRVSVTYCSYGDSRMKPTDIWSNNIYGIWKTKGWVPRPMCWNSNPKCHHERAPRGSKTGTQGLNNSYDRSVLPIELCEEILMNTTIES